MTAAEFTVDATLNSAKFGARAIASSVTARCLLWLKHQQADTRRKWRLASTPCKGAKLFGESLEPVLVESRDKRRVLSHLFRRFDRHPFPPFCRPYFRPYAGLGFQWQQRIFAPMQYNQPGQGFMDKNKLQPPKKWPFQGGSNHPFCHLQWLQGHGSHWWPDRSIFSHQWEETTMDAWVTETIKSGLSLEF